MKITDLKDYAKLGSATEVQQICSPLFRKSPINGFQFTRLYNDGSRIHLGSDPTWSELFFSEKLYLFVKLGRHPSCYHDGAYIWNHWNRKCPSYVKCGKIAEDYYNHSHGLSIVRKHEAFCDVIEMSAAKSYINTDEFYTANIDLLQNFVTYFTKTVKKLIIQAEQSKFFLEYPEDYDLYHDYNDIEKGLIHETTQQILHASDLYYKLTQREKQILAWLFQGKTAAEIAIILNISVRTVEKFIPRIKTKLNCQSLFQLGAKLAPIQHRLMLEEFMQSQS